MDFLKCFPYLEVISFVLNENYYWAEQFAYMEAVGRVKTKKKINYLVKWYWPLDDTLIDGDLDFRRSFPFYTPNFFHRIRLLGKHSPMHDIKVSSRNSIFIQINAVIGNVMKLEVSHEVMKLRRDRKSNM